MAKRIQPPYFAYVTVRTPEGLLLKTKEGRVFDGDWTDAMVGKDEPTTITDGVHTAQVRFTGVRWYDCGDLAASIRLMLEKEGVASLLPNLASLGREKAIEEGVKVYLSFNRDKGKDKTKIGAFDIQLL